MKLPWKKVRINFAGSGATVEFTYYNGRNWKTLGLMGKYSTGSFRLEYKTKSLRDARGKTEDPKNLYVGQVESGKGRYQIRMRQSECHGTEYEDVKGLGADAWARPAAQTKGNTPAPYSEAEKQKLTSTSKKSATAGSRFTCYLEFKLLGLLSTSKSDYKKYADAEREFADEESKQENAKKSDYDDESQPAQWFTYIGQTGKLKLNFFEVSGGSSGYYKIDVGLPLGGVCNEGAPCPFIATDYTHFTAQFLPLNQNNATSGSVLVMKEGGHATRFRESGRINTDAFNHWFLYPVFDDEVMKKGFSRDRDIEGVSMELATEVLKVDGDKRPEEFNNIEVKQPDLTDDDNEDDEDDEDDEDYE